MNPVRKVISFLKEARGELAKVVWPTRRRTLRLTVIVVIMTILFGAFIGVVDYGFDQGLQAVLDATGAGQGQPGAGQGQPGAAPPVQVPGAPGGAPVEVPAGAIPAPQST